MTLFLLSLQNLDILADVNNLPYVNLQAFQFLLQSNKYNISLTEKFIHVIDWPNFWRVQRDIPELFVNHFLKYITDWEMIVKSAELSEYFILKFEHLLNWENICRYQKLSEKFLTENRDKIAWEIIFEYQNLSVTFLLQLFKDKTFEAVKAREYYGFLIINYQTLNEELITYFVGHRSYMGTIMRKYQLSEAFINKNLSRLDWDDLIKTQILSESLIITLGSISNWNLIFKRQTHVSQDFVNKNICTRQHVLTVIKYRQVDSRFIQKYKSIVSWKDLCTYQIMNEDMIREFKDVVNWKIISTKCYLTDAFIRDFADKLDWAKLSMFPDLSPEIIEEFEHLVDWDIISMYQIMPEHFIEKHIAKINLSVIAIHNTNISNDFISKYGSFITHWNHWLKNIKLTEENLRKFCCSRNATNTTKWVFISQYQQLSEDFMTEFGDQLFWSTISEYQSFTIKFLLREQSRLVLNYTLINKQLSNDLKIWCLWVLKSVNLPFVIE